MVAIVAFQLLRHIRLLRFHGLQHARLPSPSLSPRVCSDSGPLSWWCHPTISSFAVPFSSCPQSFPASGSFPRSQLFASGGESTGASASASVFPMNIQGWFPLGLNGLISLNMNELIYKTETDLQTKRTKATRGNVLMALLTSNSLSSQGLPTSWDTETSKLG